MAQYELLLVNVPLDSAATLREKLRRVPLTFDRDALMRAAARRPFMEVVVYETNRHAEAKEAQEALREVGCETVVCESEKLSDRLSGAFTAISDAAAKRFGS